jgi:hypothetical protein
MTQKITRMTAQVWVHRSIDLPSGDTIPVLSAPLDRWMVDTNPTSNINRQRIIGTDNINFMNQLRDEMLHIAEHLQPGSEHEHKGFTLYRINSPS